MNQTKDRALTPEDRLISRITLGFLSTPLVLLALAGAVLAV